MTENDCRVVVVGGGAAGIGAARTLAGAGVKTLVVEARGRLGGRAWTVSSDLGFPIDLGCGWLHSADRNPWRAIAEANGWAIDHAPPPWMRPQVPRVSCRPDRRHLARRSGNSPRTAAPRRRARSARLGLCRAGQSMARHA